MSNRHTVGSHPLGTSARLENLVLGARLSGGISNQTHQSRQRLAKNAACRGSFGRCSDLSRTGRRETSQPARRNAGVHRQRAHGHQNAERTNCSSGQGVGGNRCTGNEVSKRDDCPRCRACDGAPICGHHRRRQSVSRSPCLAVLLGPDTRRELELDARTENFHHQGGGSRNALATGASSLVRLADSTGRPNGSMGETGCSTSREPNRDNRLESKISRHSLRHLTRRYSLREQARQPGRRASSRLNDLTAGSTYQPSDFPSESCPEVESARGDVRRTSFSAGPDLVATNATPPTDFHNCAGTKECMSANSRMRQLVTVIFVGLGTQSCCLEGGNTSGESPCLTRPPLHSRRPI